MKKINHIPNNICPHCRANMREKWIKLHLDKKISIPEIAKISGHHQDTLYIWKRRYLEQGIEGLIDKSRAPHSHPNEYPDDIKDKIRELRLEKNRRIPGPKTIKKRIKTRYEIEISRSGIAKFLNKEGLVSQKISRRIKNKKERIKKCRIHEPGEMLQLDIKYSLKSHSGSWFYQYSGIDYITNIAYGNIYELRSNLESLIFLKSVIKFYPFDVLNVQTDNDNVFTNKYVGYLKSIDPLSPRLHPFDILCQDLKIKHFLIDKGKPAQNGKVERFHRTCEEEFYQKEIFKDLNSLRKKFRDFLYYFNNERENQGLDGLTPLEKLQTFPGYENIKILTP